MKQLIASGVLGPLGGILAIHSIITTAGYSVPVIAPEAAPHMGLAPESVGFLVAIMYAGAMVTALLSGVMVARFGSLRLFLLLLGGMAAGCAVFITSTPLAAFAGALLIGCATGPLNPLGSHVLSHRSPRRWRAFVFSVKQCGTPAGGMIAGAVLPPLTIAWGWQGAMLTIPVAACLLMLLAPAAGRDVPALPPPSGGLVTAIRQCLRGVMLDPPVRRVALIGTCLAASQMAIGSYLVVYLWRVAGLSTELAGLAFSAMHVAGIVSRIVLGAIADRQVRSATLLSTLMLMMGLSLAALTGLTDRWPVTAIFAVTVAVGVSGNGWVGLFFSELARLASEGRTAEVAGGGQAVMYAGIVAGPLVFGAVLGWSGSYALCLWLFAGMSLLAFLMLLAAGRHRGGPAGPGSSAARPPGSSRDP